MKMPIGNKIAAGFAAALVVMAAIGIYSYRSTAQFVQNTSTAAHSRRVLQELTEVLSLAQDLETGARGYAVTGNDEYLEPYLRASGNLDGEMATLTSLLDGDPAQRDRLTSLKSLLAEKVAVTTRTVDARRSQGLEGASAVILAGNGKLVMDQVRSAVAEMAAVEDRSIDAQDQRAEARGRQTVIIVTFGSLLGVLLVGIASVVIHRDLRNRKRLEAERDGFFTLSLDLMCIADKDGCFRRLNPAWEQLGYTLQELSTRPFVEFVHPEDREATVAQTRKLADAGTSVDFENRYRCKNGSYRWLLWQAAPSPDHRFIYATARDITERKQAEAALREAEERLRLLVEGVKDYAIYMLDPAGNIASWNAGAKRIKGYDSEEVLGQHFSRFYTAEDLRRGKPELEIKTAAETGRYEEEGWRVRKDGTTFWANVVLTAVRDEAGQLRGFAKVTRDVTDRKRAEDDIKELNRALRQHATQLEAANKELEAFCYSVSHDLRAPLRSIDGFSQALLEDYAGALDEEGRDSLCRVRAATQRMGQLIDDLLNLSRVTRAEMAHETVDLSAMAREVTEELRRTDPDRAVEFVVADGIVVEADPRLMRVVLNNLLANAWKFTGKVPGARVEFGCAGVNGSRAYFVSDNGAGFDMAYAAKLFGVFQRLHAMDEFPGTGVGLATVQRIVHRHGGRVWADGQIGRGATFSFTL